MLNRRNEPWRIICDCQRHALAERKLWRRSVRVARRTAQRVGRRGAARLISGKNAQGLMQVLPSTGALMGAEDLFDPTENIAAGTKYLRYLFDRFGDERLALAAYNAGEGNVEKFGGVPPFPETLNYLRKVSSRRNEY